MVGKLTGQRFNERVVTGDPGTDTLVRMYEFEDPAGKRTWVCWKNGRSRSGTPVGVRIPARSDRLAAESLAYRAGRPPALAVKPGTDGWLSLALDERPVFVSEQDAPRRPDLVVDSLRVMPANPTVGKSLTCRVWIRNQGTRATPRGYATRVLFTADGDSIGSAEVSREIAVGQTVVSEFLLSQVPSKLSGPVTFAAAANPAPLYVELDSDNNTGCTAALVK